MSFDPNRYRNGRPMWYDRDGNPVDATEANRLLESQERIIAQDTLGAFFVSTVHLVLDHSFMGGPPLIFETAVFDQRETTPGERMNLGDELVCERTSTQEAALAAHDQALAYVREQLNTRRP